MTTRKAALAHEWSQARSHLAAGRFDLSFHHLERAHILGQLRFADHVVTHLWMLRLALARADGREARGQVLRLVATVPGHLFGWIPIGNTGGANVSALKPMPIPADLAPHFAGFDLRRQIRRQAAILGLVALAITAVLLTGGLGRALTR